MKKLLFLFLVVFLFSSVNALNFEIDFPSGKDEGDVLGFDYRICSDYAQTLYFTPMIICERAPVSIGFVQGPIELEAQEDGEFCILGNYKAYEIDEKIIKQSCKAIVQTRFEVFETPFELDLDKGLFIKLSLCRDVDCLQTSKVYSLGETFYPVISVFDFADLDTALPEDSLNASVGVLGADGTEVVFPLETYTGQNTFPFDESHVGKTFYFYVEVSYPGFVSASKTDSFTIVSPETLTFTSGKQLVPLTLTGFTLINFESNFVSLSLFVFGLVFVIVGFALRLKDKQVKRRKKK
ncbi:MAG: hypothetical protein ABH821_02620 [archaeon]